MSSVRIPPVLRTHTGGAKQVDVPAATIREVLNGLVAAYPGLSTQLLSPEGELNRFVNVFLNDTDVRHLQDMETPVSERDSVVVLPAMAGGADPPSDHASVAGRSRTNRRMTLASRGPARAAAASTASCVSGFWK